VIVGTGVTVGIGGGRVERLIRRFEQEAKTIANLQHINILPVIDYGQDQGYTDIVMPSVETGTLVDLLKGRHLPLTQVQ